MSAGEHAGAVLVTGAAGGIGRAVARRLAADLRPGWGPLVLGYRTSAPEDLRSELSAGGAVVECVRVDCGDDELAGTVDALAERHGGLAAVIHCAGPHVPMRHLSRVEPELMRRQLDSDAGDFFALVHAALPHLRRSRGCVVAVTTAATARFPVRDGLSSGPKGAVEQLVRAFAAEEGRFGVRLNCVGPGMLTDGMAARLIDSGELDERALEITRGNIPLRRFGTADDIAEAVAFLADGRRAGFVTGQKLDVDGGYGV